MNVIIERLITTANHIEMASWLAEATLFRQAAAEIERLEGEIKEWERVEVGKRHELKKLRDERNKLQDALDMARDEFQRIICLNPGPEITGLCLRGKLGVERAVPLIQSYIKLESENQRLREALSYIAMHGGTLPNDNEMHVSCNGLWCAKQAKAALGKEGQ